MVRRIHSNTLLDTIITMLLDHYAIKLPQMTGNVKKFDANTRMSFKISNKQLLKKYNQVCKRVEKLLKIEFHSKPVYGDIMVIWRTLLMTIWKKVNLMGLIVILMMTKMNLMNNLLKS